MSKLFIYSIECGDQWEGFDIYLLCHIDYFTEDEFTRMCETSIPKVKRRIYPNSVTPESLGKYLIKHYGFQRYIEQKPEAYVRLDYDGEMME